MFQFTNAPYVASSNAPSSAAGSSLYPMASPALAPTSAPAPAPVSTQARYSAGYPQNLPPSTYPYTASFTARPSSFPSGPIVQQRPTSSGSQTYAPAPGPQMALAPGPGPRLVTGFAPSQGQGSSYVPGPVSPVSSPYDYNPQSPVPTNYTTQSQRPPSMSTQSHYTGSTGMASAPAPPEMVGLLPRTPYTPQTPYESGQYYTPAIHTDPSVSSGGGRYSKTAEAQTQRLVVMGGPSNASESRSDAVVVHQDGGSVPHPAQTQVPEEIPPAYESIDTRR